MLRHAAQRRLSPTQLQSNLWRPSSPNQSVRSSDATHHAVEKENDPSTATMIDSNVGANKRKEMDSIGEEHGTETSASWVEQGTDKAAAVAHTSVARASGGDQLNVSQSPICRSNPQPYAMADAKAHLKSMIEWTAVNVTPPNWHLPTECVKLAEAYGLNVNDVYTEMMAHRDNVLEHTLVPPMDPKVLYMLVRRDATLLNKYVRLEKHYNKSICVDFNKPRFHELDPIKVIDNFVAYLHASNMALSTKYRYLKDLCAIHGVSAPHDSSKLAPAIGVRRCNMLHDMMEDIKTTTKAATVLRSMFD